jgi:hypothetical protein
MAANMQHMAGAGQMMQQQPMRKPTPNQLQQIVYQNLVQHTQPFTGICWQANVAISDRMGKTMNLYVLIPHKYLFLTSLTITGSPISILL